jgi:hypothetical protein
MGRFHAVHSVFFSRLGRIATALKTPRYPILAIHFDPEQSQ